MNESEKVRKAIKSATPRFLITYDKKGDYDYRDLYTLLEKWHAQEVLESVWMVRMGATVESIFNTLKREGLDADDGILVIQVDNAPLASDNTNRDPKRI